MLGATTENPSFQLNSALLSRSRVIVLEKLQSEDIEQLLRRALEKLGAEEKYKEDVANGKQLDSSRFVVYYIYRYHYYLFFSTSCCPVNSLATLIGS